MIDDLQVVQYDAADYDTVEMPTLGAKMSYFIRYDRQRL